MIDLPGQGGREVLDGFEVVGVGELRAVDDLLAINDRQVRTADAVPGHKSEPVDLDNAELLVSHRDDGWPCLIWLLKMLDWLELPGAIRGGAGPVGAGRGAELNVLDERRAQPVVGEEEPVVGCPVLTQVPAGIEQTGHTIRKLDVAAHKGSQ